MPNSIPSSSNITDAIHDELLTNGFDDSVPLSFTESLSGPFKSAIERTHSVITQYYNRGMLALATGADLDEKATEFGVSRGYASYLFDSSSTNFYVEMANGIHADFALDINIPITIPTSAIEISDIDGNSYSISAPIVIIPGSRSGFAPIIASTNNLQSIPAGSIINCYVRTSEVVNLDPTKANTIVFSCNNNNAIVNENTTDTDDNLRERSILRVNSMNNTNEDAIRLALRAYGITDIVFKRNMYGVGTLGLIVSISGSTQLSETTVTQLNNILANITPGARIVTPEIMTVSIAMLAIFEDTSISDATKTLIINTIKDHFLTLIPGSALDPVVITNLVLSIANVKSATIRCMFIDNRKCNITRQQALSDQRFVLDEEEPVTFVA